MSKRAEAVLVVLGFACAGIAASYPLVLHPGRWLPSDLGDPLLTAWTLAWDADRIRHGFRGIWDAPSYFPYKHTLLYSDHLLGVALFTAPVQWIWQNALLAYNAAFVGSWVLCGAGMYLLAKELTGRRDAALVAGVVYAFQPFRFSHVSHLQWLLTGWLPLSLWAMHRYFRTQRGSWLLASSAFYVLQAMTASYFTYFALVPLTIVAAVETWRTGTAVTKLIRDAIPAAILAAAVMLPVAQAYYEVRAQQGLKRSAEDVTAFSADVGDYFSASPVLKLWGGLGRGRGEHELFLGALAMALAAVGLGVAWRAPAVRLYALVGAAAFILSLGPQPSAWGHSLGIPGPYGLLLRFVPGLDGLRATARLAVVLQVATSVLAAFGAAWLLDRIVRGTRAVVLVAIVGIVAAEGWAAPLRMAPFEQQGEDGERDAYAYLKTLPSGAVMELPTDVNYTDPEFIYQFMTVIHRHPVVNGHSGYVTPLLQWLGGGHTPFRDANHQREAITMLRGLGVRYIVVHLGRYEDPAMGHEMIAAFADTNQVIHHRTFGNTALAVLAPLDVPAPPPTTAIPPAVLRFHASHSGERLPLLVDGNRDTRWISGHPQAADEWLEVGWDRARDVRVVRLQLGVRSFGDYPRDLEVSVVEGAAERTVFRGTILPQFERAFLLDNEYPWIEIVLPENHAERLRLRQLGTTHLFSWSIHELQLRERL